MKILLILGSFFSLLVFCFIVAFVWQSYQAQREIDRMKRDAEQFIAQNPGCADNSNFWRSLSARQVIAANCGK
jgi:hypothetical protein